MWPGISVTPKRKTHFMLYLAWDSKNPFAMAIKNQFVNPPRSYKKLKIQICKSLS
jgi:hypothetical protein